MNTALAVAAAPLLFILAAPGAARAQFVYSLEATGTTVSYAHAPDASGIAFRPEMKLELPRSSLVANGTLALFDRGEWSAQGFLSASLFTGTAHGVRGELAATASGIAFNDDGRSAFLVSEGRLHLADERHGVWAGAGAGGTGTRDAGSPLVVLDAGAWLRAAGATLTAAFTQSRFRSSSSASDPGAGLLVRSPAFPLYATTRLLTVTRHRVLDDAVLTLHLDHAALELDATVGARLATSSDAARQWGAVTGSLRIARGMAVVASVGHYPESFVQGFPSVHYASLGLRLTAGAPRVGEHVHEPVAARGEDFALLPDSATRRALRVIAPGARRVTVMGDFTDWTPVPLERVSNDAWETRLTIPAGTYRVSLRIDDGRWTAPPGTPARTDEFGGETGVVVVE